jgi:hypothetical protein
MPNINPNYSIELNNILVNQYDFIYIDVYNILSDKKNSGFPVFHKTDFHWTDPAGYFVMREILNQISLKEKKQLAIHDLKIEPYPDFFGWQSRFIPLFKPIKEESIQSAKNWNTEGTKIVNDQGNFEFIGYSNKADLPIVVMQGNSFGDAFIRNGFVVYFKEFYRLKGYIKINDAINSLPKGTKYFILQIIEPQIIYLEYL